MKNPTNSYQWMNIAIIYTINEESQFEKVSFLT